MDHMNHDMDSMVSMTSTMTMAMSASSTASAAMGTGSSHSMGGMGGMDGMHSSSCKISMLWNWYTIDSCFLSSQWHITSRGMFAGSCIGVICLVICLEFLRRVGREYDAFIVHRARVRNQYLSTTASSQGLTTATDADASAESSPDSTRGVQGAASKAPTQTICSPFEDKTPIRPTLIEQLVRALLHMLQFAVAYFVMLLAMYFNGYIIICIFIGAFLGSFIFSWEPLNLQKENDATTVTKCCG
ncbi:copper transporter integral membrane protein that functions in high affinity copper transport [Aspergillus pseudoviridinutans]|uniref:Copper transport protein n=1 Tax=Aspergillus pseudoviridinutans TaxID=1517512 RepID=A0A9P3B6G1_9EURO|nr:copper transporter integral membrane protein that functions in high affinity copper transport [Aspergillus pseudoviridinutans]GIJ82758.1 copper transporter integral membrane protein that functions in high affinity copper transport [Aspergillus pseudoviridinutans]